MKGDLEHKILKFLKDNDNGEYIDMRNFIDDRKKLEGKLRLLAKKPGEYISAIFPIFIFGVSGYKDDTLQAKIEMNGIILLNKIENGDKNISYNNFEGNFNGNFIQDSSLKKSPIKNKVNAQPKIKPEQKSFVKKIFSSPWTILFASLILEEITLGKLWKFIFNAE